MESEVSKIKSASSNSASESIQSPTNVDYSVIGEQNNKYFTEYKKLLDANRILKTQLNTLLKEKHCLKQKIQKLESGNSDSKSNNNSTKPKINDTYTSRKVLLF